MTDSSLFTSVRCALLALAAVLLTACTSTPGPATAEGHADYGPFPEDYQSIAKAYLQAQPTILPLNTSTAQFLNTPDKFTYSQLGRQDKYGYRVCTLVSTANGRKKMSSFLLINNDKVIAYLHDTGLVKLSDKFCNVQMLMLEAHQQAPVAAAAVPVTAAAVPVTAETASVAAVDKPGIKYLVCRAQGKEKFFVFNAEKNQLLEERDGRVVTTLAMEQLSDTFIVATGTDNTRISINRVSGTMRYQHAGTESEGSCELASRQKF